MSDCRATTGADAVPIARRLDELCVIAPTDDADDAADFASGRRNPGHRQRANRYSCGVPAGPGAVSRLEITWPATLYMMRAIMTGALRLEWGDVDERITEVLVHRDR